MEFFRVEDLEGGIRNVLLAFAGVAGVGSWFGISNKIALSAIIDSSGHENSHRNHHRGFTRVYEVGRQAVQAIT